MTNQQAKAVRDILAQAKRGQDLLDTGVIDIAMDQFIEIAALAQAIMDEEGME